MAIEPDMTGRAECCGAPFGEHWSDCPTLAKREQQRKADATRVLHALSVVGCQCGLCCAARAGHL
ncbi:hypothetical protein SEA_VIOLETZ_77 [Mycobacterium phage VioletZ]|nr:hypothetical protein SEA_MITHRIL_74 [Mycobacterium phage Mithril]QNO13099.1 hypothetical protein SEA_VIOLETZ_77 [Mycobacterium phage VioletZ]